MIGRRGLQVARLQAAPERFLMVLGPERRAHHVGAGGHRVGVVIDALVDHQVLRQALAVDALPFEARAA